MTCLNSTHEGNSSKLREFVDRSERIGGAHATTFTRSQGIRRSHRFQKRMDPTMSRRLWLQIAVLTAVLELLTVWLRFGLQFDSTRDTASTIGRITSGVRIHHGYCGAVMVLVAWGLSQTHPRIAWMGYVLGWSLMVSDVVHHLLVLWPITGSPQFDLFYPT